MDISEIIIYPQTLAILTTFKCTASCKNCCFGCNPQINARLSLKEMKNIIDQAVSFYGSTIKVLVFTGGECFLLKEDLVKIIDYGSSKGLLTRVVTNGYWANTYKSAYEKLRILKENGLREINFSTGDDHLEFVSSENIIYGCMASMDLGLTCLVNVETHDNSKFDINILTQDKRLIDYFDRRKFKNPLIISKGVWIPFNENENISYDKQPVSPMTNQRCTSLFSTVAVNPHNDLMSCCGLLSERIRPLKLGSILSNTIKELYELQFQDFVKIWLYTEGPEVILDYIHEKRGINKKTLGHICYKCAEIFKDADNLKVISDNYQNILPAVMIKYFMLKKSSI